MDSEISWAADFVVGFVRGAKGVSSDLAESFRVSFEGNLKKKYKKHWHPDEPEKGSAYRSIIIDHRFVDPLILATIEDLALEKPLRKNIIEKLPREMILWVDPGDVSYRFGDHGSIGYLYTQSPAEETTDVEPGISCPSSTSDFESGMGSPSSTSDFETGMGSPSSTSDFETGMGSPSSTSDYESGSSSSSSSPSSSPCSSPPHDLCFQQQQHQKHQQFQQQQQQLYHQLNQQQQQHFQQQQQQHIQQQQQQHIQQQKQHFQQQQQQYQQYQQQQQQQCQQYQQHLHQHSTSIHRPCGSEVFRPPYPNRYTYNGVAA